MKKRLLASLMCLCLLVGLLPATALAAGVTDCPGGEACNHEAAIEGMHYDTLKEAMGAAKNGETVDLLRNVTLTKSVETAGKVSGITLDLNGHNIDGTAVTSSNGVVWMGTKYGWKPVEGTDNTMKIINSVSDQGGEIKGTLPVQFSTGDSRYPIPGEIGEGVTLTVTGDGTDAVQLKSSAYLVYSENSRDYIKNGGFKVTAADGIERIYGSYANAAKAAHNGVVTMLHDYSGKESISSGNRVGVLDLGGNTFTYLNSDKMININYDNAGITIQNGTLTANAEVLSEGGVTALYNNTTLVLEHVTMNVPGNSYGIVTNGTNTGNTITLKDSTLNVPDGYGIYFPSSGSVAIEDSVINAKYSGVQMCSGSLTVKGDKTAITTTGEPQQKTENDGAIADGAAISVINRSYPGGTPTMSITGGTFSSKNADAVKAYTFSNTDKTEGEWEGVKEFVSISGGTFSSDVTDYLDDGCELDETGSVVPSDDSVASIGNKGYHSLEAAITEAKEGATVTLLKNVTEDVTIPANTTVTLDLNGKTLTNESSHTITNHGTLTIKDSVGGGTVDNVTHAKGALVNYGNAILESGTLTRSKEAGSSPSTSGGNSWYVVDNNKGTMTVKGGNIVSTGKFSSLIRNIGDSTTKAQLTIESGKLSNGFIAVKNDDNGDLKISGGEITSDDQAVQNWSQAEISGGTMNGAVYTWAADNSAGQMTISGDAKINGNVYSVQYVYTDNEIVHQPIVSAATKIEGGTIVGNVGAAYSGSAPNTLGVVTVSGGNFSVPVQEKYLADNLKAELQKSDGEAPYSYYPTTEEAQKHASSGDTVTDLTVSKDPDKTYHDVTLDYADGVSANLKTPVESGKSYTVPADPSRSGYDFLYWTSGGNRYYAGNTIQVNENITLTANWKEQKDDSSSGSSDNERTYAIITEDDGNGSVTVSADEASAGTRITVTVKPDAGYELDELTVTDKNGESVKLTDKGDGKYTFKMPASKVTVEAVFTAVEAKGLPSFTDVTSGDWFYDAVAYVYDKGMMEGTTDTTFAPTMNLTRSMIAQVLYNLEERPEAPGAAGFPDVAADAWYADAVNWAAARGIVKGYDTGAFGPEDSVTREQLAAILYRYAQAKGYDTTQGGMAVREFSDSASISDWAQTAMSWAVNAQVLSGKGNGVLDPQGTATRAEVAQMLMNFGEHVG